MDVRPAEGNERGQPLARVVGEQEQSPPPEGRRDASEPRLLSSRGREQPIHLVCSPAFGDSLCHPHERNRRPRRDPATSSREFP